ncbi:MAG: hypothetical protein K0R92_1016 [Lachnospiraceae bacterium]|jgi:hypothetical protein|nr:hypothetical protein [Lachnospiraceae bacterium]
MTREIDHIFNKNIELLNYSSKTILYLRLQNFKRGMTYAIHAIDMMVSVLECLLRNQSYFNENTLLVNSNSINQMLYELLNAQENSDYILLADLFEMQLNPYVISLQEVIISKEEILFDEEQYNKNIEHISKKDITLGTLLRNLDSPMERVKDGYYIEYTSSGLKTLALQDKFGKYYLHSNGLVQKEASLLARDWFSDETTDYMIYGLGLAYHIKELLELDDSIKITVMESDINVIQLACLFSCMKDILQSEQVKLCYDPHFNQLTTSIQNINENIKFVIHYPSLRNIKDTSIRERLEDYFISYSSVNNQLHSLNNNFKSNILLEDECIDSIKDKFFKKDLYIIAAGPSLDKNFMQLKKLSANSIILATGTVFKKLIENGIRPNYVIIIDANPEVLKQIENHETEGIPLLYLSTVYHRVPRIYSGKKYIIFQEGYQKSEEYAKKKCYHLYQTGGSVSTTALDIGIQFECKRIIFLGLDLAYTNNMDHASGTSSVNQVKSINLRKVTDINGSQVYTVKSLDIYRKWLERRIQGIEYIDFIDATEGGAQKSGMKIMKLSECIEEYSNTR